MLIERSANWNGDVVAITTSPILKREIIPLKIELAEKKPITKNDANTMAKIYKRLRISSRYGANFDTKSFSFSTILE
jgi:hypothetical protein